VEYAVHFNALQALGTSCLAALTLCASTAFAQSPPEVARMSAAHLEGVVTNAQTLPTVAPKPHLRSASKTQRTQAKAKLPPPAAPQLKIDMKDAARQVIRNDQAARQRMMGVGAANLITPNVLQNLHENATPPQIEMGDRPARSTSLCGDGKNRRFAELDIKTAAALLPEFNALRLRTVCARRGVVIADYAFK
jgi:hypothetical protein